jgi:hypothetical protein
MGNNNSAFKEPNYVKQSSNVSKYSKNSEIEYNKVEIREEDQDMDQGMDNVDPGYTSYSYDFEQEASLKKLLSMSNTLGYNQVQMRGLRQKQRELQMAEKALHQQRMIEIGRNSNFNVSGSYVMNQERQGKKMSMTSGHAKTTEKKSKHERQLQMIKESQTAKKRESPDLAANDGNVKDYFDNKISLRRSIEKKLHYDSKIMSNKAAGRDYPTSAQKH